MAQLNALLTDEQIANALILATGRAFNTSTANSDDYNDGMRSMRRQVIVALASALQESNPRFNVEAWRRSTLLVAGASE